MLSKEPGPERASLGFRDAVLSSFKFLGEFGLRPVEEKMTLVRYESPEVFVNVYHGRASFELGVEVGRLTELNEKLTVYDIIAWADAKEAEGFGQHVMFQVSTREGVQEFVPKLAHLIQKYGTPFLKADASAYRAVHEARSGDAVEYEKQVSLRNVRQKAEVAWHAKDYGQVVELYEPVRSDLTEVESKRLAFAEQQVLSAGGGGSPSSAQKRR
jgi:hypothetical protein